MRRRFLRLRRRDGIWSEDRDTFIVEALKVLHRSPEETGLRERLQQLFEDFDKEFKREHIPVHPGAGISTVHVREDPVAWELLVAMGVLLVSYLTMSALAPATTLLFIWNLLPGLMLFVLVLLLGNLLSSIFRRSRSPPGGRDA